MSSFRPALDLRLRILAVALIPLLLAVGLFAIYFAHRSVREVEDALERRGRDVSRLLAQAIAPDLLTGNLPQVKRLLDYELTIRGVESLAVTDGTRWLLFSGRAALLPQLDGSPPPERWHRHKVMFFAHRVILSPTAEHDPYLDSLAVADRPNYLIVAVARMPVALTRSRVALAAIGMSTVSLLLALILAWRLAGGVSQPLRRITDTVARLADGQLQERCSTASLGELGHLERGINSMAETLERNQRELENRVRAATAELLQQKLAAEAAMRAKSRFLAAASHDLRQPLHALTLLVSALKERVRDDEAHRLAQHIETSANAMATLLNALLDLSKLDAGAVEAAPTCFPLQQVLGRLSDQFAPLAREHGTRLRFAPCAVWAFSDPLLLERILANLVSNALRHAQGGHVLVGARRLGTDWIRVEVRDDGPGIPAEFQARIFEEYFQLENPERHRDKGLGLGLAIVARLARLLGGEVRVRSRPGQGACFDFRMARCPPREAQATLPRTPALTLAPGLEGALVAFIDDDADILEAMLALFDQWGIRLAASDDGAQLRDELLGLGRAPDVILSDYRLRSGHTGIEAIAMLRATFGVGIPAALLTGDTASDTIQAIRASGLPVLHKPIKPAMLRALLSHLLAGASGNLVPPRPTP